MPITKYKAAAVTSEPCVSNLQPSYFSKHMLTYGHQWFDLEASVQKTINFIHEGGENGCKLIAFPEVCKWPLPK